jgi:hypothetical protein
MSWDLDPADRCEICDRLGLAGDRRRMLQMVVPSAQRFSRELETLDSPHERFRAAASLGPIGRLLSRITGGAPVRCFLENEWPHLEACRLEITGEELRRQGISSGPPIGGALQATLDARLDGQITNQEELSYALEWIKQSEE